MPDDMVNLTIDGNRVSAPRGSMVVDAAKLIKVEIPVFCYHHKLKPVGACRLCLVDISPGPPKPQTACTTAVAEGMTVVTNSTRAVAARADILEYELVNHPLDCPVCDKGGECPLQDYTFRHGYPVSHIDQPRLHFQKPIPISERIALDRERCVLCYRCTRYYDEVAWEQELTVEQRGVQSFISNQFGQPLRSNFSGNIIDLCPVGALTSRVWRFESRPWDMSHTESICAKCSVGCSVTLWERRRQLVRVTSHENNDIDDGWICDRGRFDYTHVNDPARLLVPQVGDGPVSWEEALAAVADGLRGREVGISLAADTTNEEAYLIRKLLERGLRGARVAVAGRTLLPAPAEGDPKQLLIKEIDQARTVVVIASDTAAEVPIVNLRVKKAAGRLGASLVLVHPGRLDLDRSPGPVHHVEPAPGGTVQAVRDLAGSELLREGPIAVLYGDGRGQVPVPELRAAVAELAAATGASVMPLYRGTNERGMLGLDIGTTPDDLEGCDAILCWGAPAMGRIPSSARFVAVWDSLLRPEHGRPDVVLPDLSFAEKQGSYTNLEGRVQFLQPVLQVRRPLRESWDVLCGLGRLLGQELSYAGIYPLQREAAGAYPALDALVQPPGASPAVTPVMYGPSRP